MGIFQDNLVKVFLVCIGLMMTFDHRQRITMTRFNGEPIYIKTEPISPPTASGIVEDCFQDQGQDHLNYSNFSLDNIMMSSPSSLSHTYSAGAGSVVTTPQTLMADIMSSTSPSPQDTRSALKQKIQSGRRARGQEELVVDFESRVKREQLSSMEINKRERRKEQNRRAAQKCRVKKRAMQNIAQTKCDSLLQENLDLKEKNTELKSEVHKYRSILSEHENSGQCKLVEVPTSVCSLDPLRPSNLTPTVKDHDTLFSSSLYVPLRTDPTKSLKEQEQDSIKKIAKELEMGAPKDSHPHLLRFDTTCGSIPEINDSMEDFQNLSFVIQDGDTDYFMAAETTPGTDKSESSPDLDDIFDLLQRNQVTASSNCTNSWPKPRGVRNLGQEFARCMDQGIACSTPSNTLNCVFDNAPAIMPFCSYPPHTATTSNRELQPQLSNLDLRQGTHLMDDGFPGNRDSCPISPISSCTSPPSATSPSFFHSPAESTNQFSPAPAMGYPEVRSPYFQFPPDFTRFSPPS